MKIKEGKDGVWELEQIIIRSSWKHDTDLTILAIFSLHFLIMKRIYLLIRKVIIDFCLQLFFYPSFEWIT